MAARAVMTGYEHVLYQASICMSGLAFLYGITGTWERCLYLCKHLARAVFVMELQDIWWTRGRGANAKVTWANIMQSLLGQCVANLPCEALTRTREMDTPIQTM